MRARIHVTAFLALSAWDLAFGIHDARAQESPPAPAQPALTPASRFGQKGNLVLSDGASGGVTAALQNTSVTGASGSVTTLSLQPAADYFVIDHVSLGAFIPFSYSTTSGADANTTSIGVGLRAGYDFAFAGMFSIWPRAGVRVDSASTSLTTSGKTTSSSNTTLGLNAFVPVMFHPTQNFFVGLGPDINADVVGDTKTVSFGLDFTIGGVIPLIGAAPAPVIAQGAPKPPPIATPPDPVPTTQDKNDCRETGDCGPPPTCTADTDPTPKACIPPEKPPVAVTPPTETPLACKYSVTDGWFEPVQGPFQDDQTFKDNAVEFDRVSDAPVYYGTMHMIEGRTSVLAGIDWYKKGGVITNVTSRTQIAFKYKSTCEKTKKVKIKFTLDEQGATTWTKTTRQTFDAYIDDPPLPGKKDPKGGVSNEEDREVVLPAPIGYPAESEGAFKFTKPNSHYTITGELVDAKTLAPTGIKVTVSGFTQPNKTLNVAFVPVQIGSTSAADDTALVASTASIASDSQKFIPDIFPLDQSNPASFVSKTLSLTRIPTGAWSYIVELKDAAKGTDDEVFATKIYDQLNAAAVLAGITRVVAVVMPATLKRFESKSAVGVSPTTKTILVNDNSGWLTVAHELAHSIPRHVFTDPEMQTECKLKYHGTEANLSSGMRLTVGGATNRTMHAQPSTPPLMGWGSPSPRTMSVEQCTYKHLMDGFQNMIDPPVLFLRLAFAKVGTETKAALGPFYTVDSEADIDASSQGAWAIVLRDASNVQLAKYRFDLTWDDGEHLQKFMAYPLRVPVVAGASVVEVEGPHGVVAKKTLSATPPSVVVDPVATPAGGKAHVTWKATGEAGRTLLANVLYSADGKNWETVGFDLSDASFDVPLAQIAQGAPGGQRVRVVVTDGTRSSQADANIP